MISTGEGQIFTKWCVKKSSCFCGSQNIVQDFTIVTIVFGEVSLTEAHKRDQHIPNNKTKQHQLNQYGFETKN